MTGRAARCTGAATIAAVASSFIACNTAKTDAGPPTASASTSAEPVASVPPRTRPIPPVAQCVATSVEGGANVTPLERAADAGPQRLVVASEELRVDTWVVLDDGSRVTSRHPRTHREIVFSGPGRFRACVYFEYPEEAWVAQGALRSVPRQLETPSAQQWVITPSGALFYDAADIEVTVSARTTSVKVSSGSVDIWTGDKASAPSQTRMIPDEPPAPGWTRAVATQSITLTQRDAAPEDAAQAAVDRCLAAAKPTREVMWTV
jgi:hypothetical protein